MSYIALSRSGKFQCLFEDIRKENSVFTVILGHNCKPKKPISEIVGKINLIPVSSGDYMVVLLKNNNGYDIIISMVSAISNSRAYMEPVYENLINDEVPNKTICSIINACESRLSIRLNTVNKKTHININ